MKFIKHFRETWPEVHNRTLIVDEKSGHISVMTPAGNIFSENYLPDVSREPFTAYRMEKDSKGVEKKVVDKFDEAGWQAQMDLVAEDRFSAFCTDLAALKALS